MPAPGILKSRNVKPAKSISWQVGDKKPKGTGAKYVPKLAQSEKDRLKEKGAIEAVTMPTNSTVCAARILQETPRADRFPMRASELLTLLASRGIVP